MKPEEKALLKGRIDRDIDAVRGDIEVLEAKTKPVSPDSAIGRLTRMDAINAKSVDETTLAAARLRLVKLKRALARIDDDDFGECESCGELIPLGRLKALPESRLCVRCAETRGI